MYSRDDALTAARQFITLSAKQGTKISRAFLFGSYANDTAGDDSDIDLAVVSPEFSGFRYDDLGKIAPVKIRSNKDLEIHPFTESDFTSENPLVAEILRYGIRLV